MGKKYLTRSQPTYEGLKHFLKTYQAEVERNRSQPTYEGLKLAKDRFNALTPYVFPAYL